MGRVVGKKLCLREWKSEGKGGNRAQKIFSRSVPVQWKTVVFGGSGLWREMWNVESSSKRRVLMFKSSWEDPVEVLRTASPDLMGPLQSSPNSTTAFNTVHSLSGNTFPGLWGTTFSIFPFILWLVFLSNLDRCILLYIAYPMELLQAVAEVPSFFTTTLWDNHVHVLSFGHHLNAGDSWKSFIHSFSLFF